MWPVSTKESLESNLPNCVINQLIQVKVEKEFKRLLCKGCSCLLKPHHTAVVKVTGKHRSQKKIGLTCDLCSTRKCILIANKPAFVRKSNRRKINNRKVKGKKN